MRLLYSEAKLITGCRFCASAYKERGRGISGLLVVLFSPW